MIQKNAWPWISRNASRVLLTCILGLPWVAADFAAAQASPKPVAGLLAKNPYKFVGRLTFFFDEDEYIGSATVIKPYSLLTAGHTLYSEGSGWSSDVLFERSYDYGSFAARASASTAFILGGYAGYVDKGKSETNAGFSRDMGGIVCFSRPAKGLFAAWKQGDKFLTGKNYNMSLGYGAQVHSGEELLRSSPTRAYSKITAGFYENRSYGIEGGMSGGPVFTQSGGKWYVCAVNVSGPGGNVINRDAGVRVIDKDAASLIQNDLK